MNKGYDLHLESFKESAKFFFGGVIVDVFHVNYCLISHVINLMAAVGYLWIFIFCNRENLSHDKLRYDNEIMRAVRDSMKG